MVRSHLASLDSQSQALCSHRRITEDSKSPVHTFHTLKIAALKANVGIGLGHQLLRSLRQEGQKLKDFQGCRVSSRQPRQLNVNETLPVKREEKIK